jgi:S-adenosylmethionine:tRNA ribosyltransferase-isomerase
MRTDDLDFFLPPGLIAQTPNPDRSAARLLHYTKRTRTLEHKIFSDLPALLRAGDLMVFNNARVIPARFLLRKNTGGQVEGLFLSEIRPGRWRVLLRNVGRYSGPLQFVRAPHIGVALGQSMGGGEYEIDIQSGESATRLLDQLGRMPLPPYIKRDKDHDSRDEFDRVHYQTVYAKHSGSVAAPTAGLHFTDDLLRSLDALGVEQAQVTLHVGMGTFKPVTAEVLAEHAMHSERYEVDAENAAKINAAETEGRRIVAIGTTSARVLESYPDQPWQSATGETSIFIYPPYRWKRVGALVTNFHLPRSTLIALVAAMVGLDEQRRIYGTAIEKGYHFFSYGDAMFIE